MSTGPPPVPAGWRLRVAAGARILGGGRTLVGGYPLRVLTLSPRGAQLVSGWLAGQPVQEDLGARRLARRLLDAGLVDPDSPPSTPNPNPPPSTLNPNPTPPTESPVTIVVPVYADPERLAACLAPLAGGPPVIVVDDGSPDGEAIADVAERFGVRYIRHPGNRGQAAARNTGWRAANTPLVAFLDADCVPPPGFPGSLIDHLADPAIGLVAPRIVSGTRSASRIARYERVRSALDMGTRPSLVRPYSPVWYVPSAAMVARRAALGRGFDERLSLGEDVDLVWRLHDAGWQIRYEPRITVAHENRVRPVAWYRRRIAYNESVAPLLERHPERVPVLFLSPTTALVWAAALGGMPTPVVALAGVRAARLWRAVAGRLPRAGGWAARAALEMTVHEARDLGRALAGPWAPLALLVGRRRAAALIATMLALDWLTDRPALDPLSYTALRLADESSRGVGIWLGCIRARDFRGLLPRRPPPPSLRQGSRGN